MPRGRPNRREPLVTLVDTVYRCPRSDAWVECIFKDGSRATGEDARRLQAMARGLAMGWAVFRWRLDVPAPAAR